jgi:ribose transport system permease protein
MRRPRAPLPSHAALAALRRSSRHPVGRAAVALLLVLLLGCVFHGQRAFFSLDLHLDLWGSKGVIGLLAIGQCLVILGGGIDLSVGSVLALCNVSFAGLMLAGGWPWWLAVPAAMAAGALVGTGNGLLVARVRLQPFLATLATMVIARGIARFLPVLAGQPASSKFLPGDGVGPAFWQFLGGRLPGGLPVVGALFAVATIVAALAVRRLTAGRWLYAVGGNEEAARLCGVPTARVKAASYALCGACAGLAGVCQAVRDVQGNPGAGEMFELEAIAAVVIGGNSLRGGVGGVGLAAIGVLTVGYIDKVLSINGMDRHWRLMIQGLIILLAVSFQDRRR